MCTPECVRFAESALRADEVEGKDVLEVGSRDFNGSVRSPIQEMGPATYVAVDMLPGPGVDVVCNAEELVAHFGSQSFDVLVSTEMLEHTREWRTVVSNLKRVLRPDGVLVLTTRSKGFPFHGCPGDYWRYEVDDFRAIFSDLAIERLETDDPAVPGVFLKAKRPLSFTEADLSAYKLYSIIRRRRVAEIGSMDVLGMTVAASGWKAVKAVLPTPLIDVIRRRAWHTV